MRSASHTHNVNAIHKASRFLFFTSIQPSSHGRCKKFSLLVPKYSYFQAAEKLLIKMHRQALCCCCYFRAQGSGKGKCCRYRKPSLTRGREPVVNSWLYICNTEALLTILQQIFVRNEPSFYYTTLYAPN
jgi:hypothetical protein